MADVATWAISGQPYYEGSIFGTCDKFGTSSEDHARALNGLTPAQIETKYKDRFDNRTYY